MDSDWPIKYFVDSDKLAEYFKDFDLSLNKYSINSDWLVNIL